MGGNAFGDVGTIHRDEISPTLDYIAIKTHLKDVHNCVLGSVGKKEYSGDIDLALAAKTPEEIDIFVSELEKVFGHTGVRKLGAVVTTRVPIQQYKDREGARLPREKYVQVDYVFGDIDWFKFFYHSPGEFESKLKGTHRNIAISTLSGFTDRIASTEIDEYDRPVDLVRWKWSSKSGLVKIRRISKQNEKTGKWYKKQYDEVLADPLKDEDKIAEVLFKGRGTKDKLNSAEDIINTIKRIYDIETQEAIFKKMAYNFSIHYDIGKQCWEYPVEIAQHMEKLNEVV